MPTKVVLENFRNIFKEAFNDEDIWQAFRIEEALLELDTKLEDFVETRIEVDNYRQKIKDKYEALDLSDVAKITEIIEKFRGKHPHIALGWRGTKFRSQNFIFDT